MDEACDVIVAASAYQALIVPAAAAIVLGAIGLMFTWLNKRLNHQDVKVQEVHVMVNTRLTDALLQTALMKLKLAQLTGDVTSATEAGKEITALRVQMAQTAQLAAGITLTTNELKVPPPTTLPPLTPELMPEEKANAAVMMAGADAKGLLVAASVKAEEVLAAASVKAQEVLATATALRAVQPAEAQTAESQAKLDAAAMLALAAKNAKELLAIAATTAQAVLDSAVSHTAGANPEVVAASRKALTDAISIQAKLTEAIEAQEQANQAVAAQLRDETATNAKIGRNLKSLRGTVGDVVLPLKPDPAPLREAVDRAVEYHATRPGTKP